jgi:hypothetical protein
MAEKKKFLLRIDANLYSALEKWAADDLRSINAQIEFLLSNLVRSSGRRIIQKEHDSSSNESKPEPHE